MRAIGLDRKSRDYLDTLNIDPYSVEERFIHLESLIKANLAFKTKLENFKQFIDCLSADRCFSLWISQQQQLSLCHIPTDQIEQYLQENFYNLCLPSAGQEYHVDIDVGYMSTLEPQTNLGKVARDLRIKSVLEKMK